MYLLHLLLTTKMAATLPVSRPEIGLHKKCKFNSDKMKKTRNKPMGINEREAIVQEYLTGTMGYRELAVKYGYHYTNIGEWVRASLERDKSKKAMKIKVNEVIVTPQIGVSDDIRKLQAELHKAQLQNRLLNTMIDIAEEQLKINIRKKSGTKQ